LQLTAITVDRDAPAVSAGERLEGARAFLFSRRDGVRIRPSRGDIYVGNNPLGRDKNRDRGALAGTAFDRERAAMHLDQVFGERQPESGSLIFTAELTVDLAERFERLGEIGRASW